jgi:hypothetical protein
MPGEHDLIEISLLSGQSDRPALTFTPGAPQNPVSVGTAGQWIVSAEGVGPVHLYLVFDGLSVHVASASANAQVLLAGSAVGANWVKAPIPCELRFGGACVIMRYAPSTVAHVEEERTVHDGGALWQAAQRAAQDAMEKARQAAGAQSPQLGAQFAAPRPAAGAPLMFGSTVPLDVQSPVHEPPKPNFGATVPMDNQAAFREAVAKATSSAPPPMNDDAATTVRAPPGASPPPQASPPGAEQDVTMIAPQRLMPRMGGPSGPPGGYAPTPPPTAGYAPAMNAPPAGVQPTRALQEPTHPGAADVPGAATVKGYWQAASPVKKATLVLMPFALVMSYFMLQPEAPPPPPKVIAGAAASAKRAGTLRDGGMAAAGSSANALSDAGAAAHEVPEGVVAAGTASGGATDEAPTTAPPESHPETPPPKLAPLAPGKRTAERMALDAVAAGSFDEAAKLLAALAAAHPDDPSYKEAARILREKSGQPK